MKQWKWLFSIGMAFVLAGCAALSSFNWMAMINKRYEVTSGQGTMNFQLTLYNDQTAAGKMTRAERDTWRKLQAFQNAALIYNRVKENASVWSWDGALHLQDGTKIPLKANVRDGQFAVSFDGQTAPLVIPLHILLTSNGWTNIPMTEKMKTAFDRRFAEIVPVFVKFIAAKMPVPDGMTVGQAEVPNRDDQAEGTVTAPTTSASAPSPVAESGLVTPASGEAVSTPATPAEITTPKTGVTDVFVSLNAEQLTAFATGLLQNVLADQAGLDQTTEKIFALLTVPASTPADKAVVAEGDKLILNILKQYIRGIFEDMLEDWKKASRQNSLKVAWRIDSAMTIRAFQFDLTYYPVRPWAGLKGYRVNFSRESWNAGKALKADEVAFDRWSYKKEFSSQPWMNQVTAGTAVDQIVTTYFQAERKTLMLKAPATPKPTPVPKTAAKGKAAPAAKGKKPAGKASKATPAPTPKTFEKETDGGVLWRIKGADTELHFSADWLQAKAGWVIQSNGPAKDVLILVNDYVKPVNVPAKKVLWIKNKLYLSQASLKAYKLAEIEKNPGVPGGWTIVTDP